MTQQTEPDALFSAAAVARLSEGVCGVGVYVEAPGGVRGRIVAPDPSRGGWWLVKTDSRGLPVISVDGSRLAVRS